MHGKDIWLTGMALLALAASAVSGPGPRMPGGQRLVSAGAPTITPLPRPAARHAPAAPVVACVGGFTPGGCVQVCEDVPYCEEIREMPALENDAQCIVALNPENAGFRTLAKSCPAARTGGVEAIHDGKKYVLRCRKGK